MSQTDGGARPSLVDISDAALASQRQRLRDVAERCQVLDEYRFLVDALDAVDRRDPVDFVVATEVPADLALVAVGRRRAYVVRPMSGRYILTGRIDIRLPLGRVRRCEVSKRVVDGERQRWLMLDADDEFVRLRLSPRAAEAASHVARVVEERARAQRQPAGEPVREEPDRSRASAMPVQLRELAELHGSGLLSDQEYAAVRARLLQG